MVQEAFAVAAALVALAFAMSTFERWLDRRRPHELAWTVALAMFCLPSAALAAGAGAGWNGPTFRLFYLLGAVTNVPVLAIGTVYLLRGETTGRRFALSVAAFCVFAAGVISVAPFTSPVTPGHLPRGSEVFGALPRILAALGSAAGALVILVGAVWSAARERTSRPRLAVGNALIALGTLVLATSGLLNSVLDEMTAFAVTLAIGVTLLFAGFVVASSEPRVR